MKCASCGIGKRALINWSVLDNEICRQFWPKFNLSPGRSGLTFKKKHLLWKEGCCRSSQVFQWYWWLQISALYCCLCKTPLFTMCSAVRLLCDWLSLHKHKPANLNNLGFIVDAKQWRKYVYCFQSVAYCWATEEAEICSSNIVSTSSRRML